LAPGITVRSRRLPSISKKKYKSKRENFQDPPGYPAGVYNVSVSEVDAPYLGGMQTTVSEGHPVSRLRKGGLQDIGGNFETTKEYVVTKGARTNIRDSYITQIGPGVAVRDSTEDALLLPRFGLTGTNPVTGRQYPIFPLTAKSSNARLNELGATAIARCKPTNPPVDAGQALGELFREGLPHLPGSESWKARTDVARSAGKDYLNAQFGWRPLVNDISDFVNTVKKFDSVISQYERDAGKVVRRNYRFPTETTSDTWKENTEFSAKALCYGGNGIRPDGLAAGPVEVTEETVIDRWFSGAFTYYLPSGYDSRNQLSKLALIADRFGLDPSPDLVWELTPWSWAVDWFSNAGDVISNVSDFANGGLVMRYGYIMEHSIRKRTYTQPRSGFAPQGNPLAAGPVSLVTETKVRRQADPFGFGVSWEGLSTFQASILAALGISRRS